MGFYTINFNQYRFVIHIILIGEMLMLENSYGYAIHIIKKHFSFIMFYYQLSINLRKLSWIGIDLQEIEKKNNLNKYHFY